tara:strand:+ start:270 stop:530 length:261 start_codon:yes stop_codon:yes gene_type:complete
MDLESLKSRIENMTKQNQLEILKILNNCDTKLNENKSGVFVNLSYLPEKTLEAISEFIKYIDEQETNLKIVEDQKKEFQDNFFCES